MLKTFDLVAALSGARIVTKNGRPVANLTISKTGPNGYPLKGFFRNLTGYWESATWNLKGEFTNNVDSPKNLMLMEFTVPWTPITVWPNVFDGKVVLKQDETGKTVEEHHFRLLNLETNETWEGPFPYYESEGELENIKATHWSLLAPTPKEMEEHQKLMNLKVPVGETITENHYAIFNGELTPISQTPYKREIGNKCQTIDQVTIFRNPYELPLEGNDAPPPNVVKMDLARLPLHSESASANRSPATEVTQNPTL